MKRRLLVAAIMAALTASTVSVYAAPTFPVMPESNMKKSTILQEALPIVSG